MNRNRLVILTGIVLLAGLLLYSWAGQTGMPGKGCCGGCPRMTASSMPASCDRAQGMNCCDKCACPMMEGAGKEAYEAYMKKTAGLRNDLADARAELNTLLMVRPIDKAAVSRQVERVNSLQSKLYTETVDMWVAVNEKLPAGKSCEMCKGPVACCMMMSDQCPMRLGADKAGCCCGCCSAPAKPVAAEAGKCKLNACMTNMGEKPSK